MCSTCGCGQPDDAVKIQLAGEKVDALAAGEAGGHDGNHDHHGHEHHHHHGNGHGHEHHHHSHTVNLEADILQKNNLLAERNRGFFDGRKIHAYNLMSSPGSGKTTLLEKTIQHIKDKVPMYIIEGDQQTMHDADRIAATGVQAVQINTGKGCHLDAHMVLHALQKIDPESNSLLFIENVGNLVCPSLFDLGEKHRVVIMSTTEGEDKPLKYPTMYESSDICIINKTDLLPYVDFDVEKVKDYARRINPNLLFFTLSSKTGEGIDQWCTYLLQEAGVAVH
jgi:hydrogenase nickel incorporation protein HypB